MSPTFPLVTFSLVLSAFVGTTRAVPVPRKQDKLLCSYEDHSFRVSDGVSKWEKYVANWDQKEVKLACGEKIAAGLIGSYFVFFSEGKIQDLFVGSFAEDRRVVALQGDLAAAAMGANFVIARAGGTILSATIANPRETPKIAFSRHFAATVMGNTFVVSDGLKTEEKYIGGGTETQVVANAETAAALTGRYFVGFAGGKVLEKFIGNRTPSDTLVRGTRLIAASVGKSFVVLDSDRAEILERFVGESGKVSVVNGIATHERPHGRVTRYNAATGKFTP